MSYPVLQASDIGLQMKKALRRLAKSVAVIACGHEGRRYAMAATAVSEITIDPPSLLICVNRGASIHLPMSAGAEFSVNILHASHREIAELCSGKVKGDARFTTGLWIESDWRVEAVRHSGEVDPLVYLDRRFTSARKSA